jgi:uncharacterized iron-regulated protein
MQTSARIRLDEVARKATWVSAACALAVMAGCARSAKEPVIGTSSPHAAEPPPVDRPAAKKPPPARPEVPDDAVERAALPYHGLRAKDGQTLTASELMDELAQADAICVGENHPNPHDHFAQLSVLRELVTRAGAHGRELGLGLEMLDFTAQEALDEYASKDIGERTLIKESQWKERWGYPFALYRPMLDHARDHGVALLALNVPRELTRQVAKQGVEGLPDETRKTLPEMDFKNSAHRQHFDNAMRQHPHGHGSPENMYAAQVLWDETMAAAAAAWLAERAPARQVVILAGHGHCLPSAIPQRMQRRGIGRAVSVAPTMSVPERDAKEPTQSFDYALIFEASAETPPPKT